MRRYPGTELITARDRIKNSCRQQLTNVVRDSENGERCKRRGLQDDSISCHQCGQCFRERKECGKVPGTDSADNANGSISLEYLSDVFDFFFEFTNVHLDERRPVVLREQFDLPVCLR